MKHQFRRHGLAEQVRNIIRAFKGDRFIIADIADELEDNGIEFDMGHLRQTVYYLAGKDKFIDKIGTKDGQTLYRQPHPRRENVADDVPVRSSELLIAILSAFRNCSGQRLKHEFMDLSNFTDRQFESARGNVIARLKARGQLVSDGYRPAVYSVTPKFYQDLCPNIGRYIQAVPALEKLIRTNFGEYVEAPSIETHAKKSRIVINPEDDLEATHGLTPADIGGAILAFMSKVLQDREEKHPQRSMLDLENKLFDAQGRLITLDNTNRSLRMANKKLEARLASVQEQLDAMRVQLHAKSALEQRAAERNGESPIGSFPLSDVATVIKKDSNKKPSLKQVATRA